VEPLTNMVAQTLTGNTPAPIVWKSVWPGAEQRARGGSWMCALNFFFTTFFFDKP
jgi:hypothetical protein